jgi:hypothetical protein
MRRIPADLMRMRPISIRGRTAALSNDLLPLNLWVYDLKGIPAEGVGQLASGSRLC